MRIYDPRVGKFLSVDPLTPKYPELTSYQFASNRPIDGIDEDGLEYSPAGNNTGGVPRDNTSVQKYVKHPESIAADFKFNKAVRMFSGSSNPAGLNSKPNLSPTMQRRENERMAQAFLDKGWNADGSEPGWHKLATNKTFSNLSKNMLMPMVEMAVADGTTKIFTRGMSLIFKETEYVYRFDERSIDEIRKAGGFTSWGGDMDLLKHASGETIANKTSGYVSTSYKDGGIDCIRRR